MFGIYTKLIKARNKQGRAFYTSRDRSLGRSIDLNLGISTTEFPVASDHPPRVNNAPIDFGEAIGEIGGVRQKIIQCQPTTYETLRVIFRRITVRPGNVFVDFGCGLGRTVCFAAQYPFSKIFGVEVSPRLAAGARSNVEGLRSKAACRIEIVCTSAEDFDCRLGDTFYLFNPFGEKMLAAVLTNIKSAAACSRRPIRIIYNNPVHRKLLDESGWLSKRRYLRVGVFDGMPVLLYESN